MKNNPLNIRPAVHQDMAALVRLLQTLFSLEADFSPDPQRQEQGLQRFLDGCGEHRAIFVAEADSEVIGMATIQTLISTAEGGPVGLVEDVVVLEDHRGRGAGRRLVGAVMDWASERGFTRLQLLADRDNHPALGFYHNIGWEPTRLICLKNRMARRA